MGSLLGNVWSSVVVAGLAAGCSGEVDEFSCSDPKYANGTCDLDTTCGAPDVDCFVTFRTPDEASAWYTAWPGLVAARGPALPTDDVRFAPAQALIDEGWEAYKAVYEVGLLADYQPQLVLVDNDVPNAFALADQDRTRAGLAVMVNTGLINAGATKSQILGVIMHEFQHAAGLHVNQTVKASMLRYYHTPANTELIGAEQPDDPAVRALFEQWLTYQRFTGYASDVELGGLSLMPGPQTGAPSPSQVEKYGLLGGPYFGRLLVGRAQMVNTTACTTAVQQLGAIHDPILATTSPLDDDITATTSQSSMLAPAVTAVRDQCFAGQLTPDALGVLAAMSGIPDATLRAAIPPMMKAKIELANTTQVIGWYNAVFEGRLRMREIEASFMTMFGVPWSRLRMYTTEEAADDASVRVMLDLGLEPDGCGQLLVGLNSAQKAACEPLLASNTAPYGQNLTDDHHATCWRQQHMRAFALTNPREKIQWKPVTFDGIVEPSPPWMD